MRCWPYGIGGVALGLCLAVGVGSAEEKPAPVYPNFLLEISRELANEMAKQDIDQEAPIDQRKGRLTICGSSRTRAVAGVDFVPSANVAALDLTIVGGTDADTRACMGPVCLFLTTRVSYSARKLIGFDENGIQDLCPARSCPQLDENTLNCLQTKFRGPLDPLVRKIATRVYYRKQAETEAGIVRDARKEIEKTFDETAAKEIIKANERIAKEIREPMQQRHIWPQRFHFLTTQTQLGVRALLKDPAGKPQSFTPVPEVQDNLDVALRVEETFPNNVAQGALAGKTFTSQELEKEFNLLAKPLGKEIKMDDPGDKPFTITFPKEKPITVKFDKQMVAITIRGEEYTSGNTAYDGMDTTGIYKLKKSELGIVAERVGDLIIYPPGFVPGKDKLGAREQVLRKLLEKKFGKVLTPKFEFTPGKVDLLTAQIDVDKGWLVLGLIRDPKSKPAEPKPTISAAR